MVQFEDAQCLQGYSRTEKNGRTIPGSERKNDSEPFLAPANLLQIKRKTDLLTPRLAGEYFIPLFSS